MKNYQNPIVLSKEVVQGLKIMQQIGSKVMVEWRLAKPADYERWLLAMEETQPFWEEVQFNEKVAIAMQRYNSIDFTNTDLVNLSDFFKATVTFLEQIQPLLAILTQANNASYHLDVVSKIFGPINKKANLIIKEGEL